MSNHTKGPLAGQVVSSPGARAHVNVFGMTPDGASLHVATFHDLGMADPSDVEVKANAARYVGSSNALDAAGIKNPEGLPALVAIVRKGVRYAPYDSVEEELRDARLAALEGVGCPVDPAADESAAPGVNSSVVWDAEAWRDLLVRYIRHVHECEGTTFIDTVRHSDVIFTPGEMDNLVCCEAEGLRP